MSPTNVDCWAVGGLARPIGDLDRHLRGNAHARLSGGAPMIGSKMCRGSSSSVERASEGI